MRGLKTSLALAGAHWAWKRHRRGSAPPPSTTRRNAEFLALGAAAAALGVGASALSEHRRARRMSGKVALVTGGSRGLGLQLAREFGASGASVVICARGREDLDRAVAELTGRGVEAHGVVCDVTDPEEIEALLDAAVTRFGRLDVVVNSAGTMRVGPQETHSDADFAQAMDIMFWGPFHLSRAAVERMRAAGGGTLVNVTSIGAYLSVPHMLPYSVAKHAWAALSEGLAAETGGTGVRVTTVAPGLMRTGSHKGVVFSGDPEREYAWFALAAGLPLLSVSAEHAARSIVHAAATGRGFLVVSPVARLGMAMHGVAPGLTQRIMRLAGRALPTALDPAEERSGAEAADSRVGRLVDTVTVLNERAGRRMNQRPASEGERTHGGGRSTGSGEAVDAARDPDLSGARVPEDEGGPPPER
ncbi:SDR family oxidoreductase [Nocardiopsis sp. MG754419]|uniref:SDR family NAD(P)-dependent oxidoreductase n=1 Tax=Nocardiopsis sp. MG754419 TaxID=2259865 RepID=UPI001BADF78B|nr:SDR family oxidoreductase [Nocardiopsis sp. MG754419]MBR8740187.1 short-chain dehydrogenase [Nocardiopsis sp. MG754419]